MVCRKRSIDEADERSSDVGFDVFVIHITFLRRMRFCGGGPCGGGLNSSWCAYPLFLNASWYASWYGGAA